MRAGGAGRGEDREERSRGSGGTGSPPGLVGVRRVEQHTDARGAVYEPLDPEALARQRNAHVVLTGPGHVRGNHLHRKSTEVLAVHGPARVRFRDAGGLRDVHVEPGDVVAFTIPPGVPHAILNTGTEPSLLVAFRDTAHDPEAPDTERVELLRPEG